MSLTVVSVRSARPFLEVLLDLGGAVVDLDRWLHAGRDDLGVEASGGLARDAAAEHDRDLVGAPERELIRERALKPGATGGGPVKHVRVGELKLPERQLVAVAAATVLGGKRRRQTRLPARKERPHVCGRKSLADAGQRGLVLAGGEPVVQGGELDPLPGGLLLGPFVAVEVDPDRERRVGDRLDERRPPVGVADVEVVVVREDRLAPVLKVRMPVRAAVAPAPPGRGLLLRDADQHHAVAALLLGALEVLACDLFLDIALGEAHDRDLVIADQALDRLDVVAADLAQHRGGGDREPAIEQKPDHLPLGLQARHVALQEQAIDRAHLQRHVIAQ